MKLTLVLAIDNNKLIGNKNKLPWKLSNDLQHFKDLTNGSPIVMGRKTFKSIGRVLPNRTNIVITKDENFKQEGVVVFNSIDAFMSDPQFYKKEVFLIGGANLIKQLYHSISTFHLTHVKANCVGDCYVDYLNVNNLEIVSEDHFQADVDNEYDYSFITYIAP